MTREEPKQKFEFHVNDIPFVDGETDAARYLRAFAHMLGDDLPITDGEERIHNAARDAISFIADDAFRLGFESCHQNVVEPLRESTISREDARNAMAVFGERVRQTIVGRFEEAPGVPNQIVVDIEEVELPQPKSVLR